MRNSDIMSEKRVIDAKMASKHGRSLVERLMDNNKQKKEDEIDEDVLHDRIEDFISEDCIEVLQLIQSKMDINHIYANGCTALHIACRKGYAILAEHLLRNGATMTEDSIHFLLPVHLSASNGHTACLKVLLNYGATGKAYHRLTGKLPLHFAAQCGNPTTVTLLLQNDSDGTTLNAVDNEHHTPLHLAVIDGNIEITQLLVQHGCNKDLKDINGKTALDLANMLGRSDIAEALSGGLFAGMKISTNRRLSIPAGRWVALKDGKFVRMDNQTIPIFSSRFAAAHWLQSTATQPAQKRRPSLLDNISDLMKRNSHLDATSSTQHCAVAEIAADKWCQFSSHHLFSHMDEYDPQLEAYRQRRPSATQASQNPDSCEQLSKRVAQLKDDIDILQEAVATAKQLLEQNKVSTDARHKLDLESFSSLLVQT